MPRKVAADLPTMRTEIDATNIALEVDEQAAPLVGATLGWDGNLPALEDRARQLALGRLRAQVTRDHLNRQLDPDCLDFLSDLRHLVKGDRNHPDYALHVSVSPSAFVRVDFYTQVREVKRWIALDHPLLAPYKARLTRVVARAEALEAVEAELEKTARALQVDIEAEAVALTAKRDDLHRLLGEHAKTHGLERGWGDGFFLRG